MLTAYDATMARLLDRAGVDVLLVGDSVGVVVLGYEHTLPVTLDDMLHHTRAVARGASRALVVADMPFMTYQVSVEEAVRNAGRLLQAGAAAVKVEGGPRNRRRRPAHGGGRHSRSWATWACSRSRSTRWAATAARRVQREDIEALVEDAHALERAGAFAIVLEAVGHDAARHVTAAVAVPTIGIGAGPDCDGQVLVSYDMLGLFDGHVPSFVKQYAQLADEIARAARDYVDDVRAGRFPEVARPLETRQS